MSAFVCHQPLAMTLGEGPFWDRDTRRLYWVDITAGQLHRLDGANDGHAVTTLDEPITCVARHANGGFIAGMRSGIWTLDADGRKDRCMVEIPEGQSNHRFNDGRCDPAGRLWVGTMNEDETTADAHLYCYDGRALRTTKSRITISNGLAFSPDHRFMYHTDTPRRSILRHAFDVDSGEIDSGELWVDLDALDIEGHPDGAAVDADGHYWCALFGGAAVVRFDPDGCLVARYAVAAPNPTMPAFGGDDLRTLFVTTARQGMTDDDLRRWPAAGSLFAMPVDTPGLSEPQFALAST